MNDTYDDFLEGYIACALWSSTDESEDNRGNPMDDIYTRDDIATKSLEEMQRDCRDFIEAAGHLLDGADASQAGHDFWLTRNRHGAGFWDRAPSCYPNDPKGKQLTELAHSLGECNLYVGDDCAVHVA